MFIQLSPSPVHFKLMATQAMPKHGETGELRWASTNHEVKHVGKHSTRCEDLCEAFLKQDRRHKTGLHPKYGKAHSEQDDDEPLEHDDSATATWKQRAHALE